MGKRLRVQRRGRGSPTFKALAHKRVSPSCYVSLERIGKSTVKGCVQELLHEPGRGSPLVKIRLEEGYTFYTVAPEAISVDQELEIGPAAQMAIGNVLPLGAISPGVLVCNVELTPGDGGKIARASGTYAAVVAHTSEGTLIKLPSGKSKYINDSCLATIGIVSGAGRTDKPFLKAGQRDAWLSSKGRVYPITKGVAMNAAFHPHGGGAHKSSSMKPTSVSRLAPPGQKVGLIAARQSGRKKRRTK